MQNNNALSKRLFNKQAVNNFLEVFMYSNNYPIVLGIIAIFSFITNMQLGGFTIFLIFACIVLVRNRDITPILPLLIFLMPIFRDVSVTGNLIFYLMLIPLVVCLIYHLIKFPPNPFCFGKLFLPLLSVTATLFCGGILSPYTLDYGKGLLYILPLGPGLLVIYLIFNNYLRPPENFDMKRYFSVILIVLGFICSIEFGYYFLNRMVLGNELFKSSEFGWANINGVGTLLIVCLPACFYLMLKDKNIIKWCLLVAFFYFIIYSTGSDGALGVSGFFLPFMLYFTYKKFPKKQKRLFINLIFFAIVLTLIVGIILQLTGKLQTLIDKFTKALTNDTGRSDLYRDALKVFSQNPIFGGGMGYYNDNQYESSNIYRNFSFHSTLFTVLGCLGTMGLLAYIYYFYKRYQIIVERDTSFNLFIYFAFSMFECYGFVDTCEFSAIPQMILITLIIAVTDLTNIKGNDESLPLIFYFI